MKTIPNRSYCKKLDFKEEKEKGSRHTCRRDEEFFFFLKNHFDFRWSLKEDEEFVLF